MSTKFVPPIVSVVQNKGGVGKTTSLHCLAWSAATAGAKVLCVDADSQMNLTQIMNPHYFTSDKKLKKFKEKLVSDKTKLRTIVQIIKPIEKQQTISQFAPELAKKIHPIPHPHNPIPHFENQKGGEIFLIAGGMDLSKYESKFSLGFENQAIYNEIPGMLTSIIRQYGTDNNYDLILIDLSPSIGDFNRAVILGSDYFYCPTFPDLFSKEGCRNILNHIPKWYCVMDYEQKRKRDSKYPPLGNEDTTCWHDSDSFQTKVKFLGAVVQKLKSRKNKRLNNKRLMVLQFKQKLWDIADVVEEACRPPNLDSKKGPPEKGLIGHYSMMEEHFKHIVRNVTISDSELNIGKALQYTGFPICASPGASPKPILIEECKNKVKYVNKRTKEERQEQPPPDEWKDGEGDWQGVETEDYETKTREPNKQERTQMERFRIDYRRLLGSLLENMDENFVSPKLKKCRMWAGLRPTHYCVFPSSFPGPLTNPSNENGNSDNILNYWYRDQEVEKLLTHYVGQRAYVLTPLADGWLALLEGTLHQKVEEVKSMADSRRKVILQPLNVSGRTNKNKSRGSEDLKERGGAHWTLLILGFNNHTELDTVCYFDSLGKDVPEQIKDMFQKGWEKEVQCISPNALQTDSHNCGTYIVEAARKLVCEDGTLREQRVNFDRVQENIQTSRMEHDTVLKGQNMGSAHECRQRHTERKPRKQPRQRPRKRKRSHLRTLVKCFKK